MTFQWKLEETPTLWYERKQSLDPDYVRQQLALFLAEDMPRGDATTLATVPPEQQAHAQLIANQDLSFAGRSVLELLWSELISLDCHVADGETVEAGTVLAEMRGPAQELLSKERVMLNLIQRLSGIASLTRQYLQLDLPPHFKLLDTRKMTPGLRLFEKYAVAVGGAYNHRINLSHVIMIKDNHVVAAGGIVPALEQVRARNSEGLWIELEVDHLEQLDEALETGVPHAYLLDNMSPETICEAVRRVREHPKGGMQIFLEASGGITYDSLSDYAWTGVNGISVGALTTQARNVDIKLEFVDS